jgi:hypothetical protein
MNCFDHNGNPVQFRPAGTLADGYPIYEVSEQQQRQLELPLYFTYTNFIDELGNIGLLEIRKLHGHFVYSKHKFCHHLAEVLLKRIRSVKQSHHKIRQWWIRQKESAKALILCLHLKR